MVSIADYNLVIYVLISNNFHAATVFAYGQTASGKTFVSDTRFAFDCYLVLKMLVFVDYGKVYTINIYIYILNSEILASSKF